MKTSSNRNKSGENKNKDADKKRPNSILRAGRLICRLIVCAVLMVLALVAYLVILGVPQPITKHFLADFNMRQQMGVSVERVRFYPPNVIWVSGIRVQGGKPDVYPLIECRDVWVRIDWKKFPEASAMPVDVSLKGCNVNLRLHEETAAAPSPKLLGFEDVVVRIKRESEREWRVASAAAKMGNASFSGVGKIRLGTGAGKTAGRLGDWAHTRILQEYMEKHKSRDRFNRIHKSYADLEFPGESAVRIEFEIDTGEYDNTAVTLSAESERMTCRGIGMDDVSIDANLEDREINVPALEVEHDGEKSSLSLSYNLDTKKIALKGAGVLPSECIKALMPPGLEQRISARRLDFSGEVQASFECGPVAVSNVVENFTAETRVDKASVRGLALDDVAIKLRRQGDRFTVKSFRGIVGEGSLQGHGMLDLEENKFAGEGVVEADPRKFLTLFKSEKLESRINGLEIGESLVKFDGKCSGDFEAMDRLYVSGKLQGKDFAYRGVAVESFDSHFAITNKVIEFNQFSLKRAEGDAGGSVRIDMNRDMVMFDAVSDCAPKKVAQIISTNLPPMLDPVDFMGPFHIEAKGEFDYDKMEDNDIEATVSARNVLLKKVLFNEAVFRSSLKGSVLKVYDLTGVLYEGTYNGNALFDISLEEDTPTEYEVEMDVSGMKFSKFMERFKGPEKDEEGENVYTGRINAEFDLNGSYSNKVVSIASGSYEVAIREGRLFRIPLLGGLSQYLSKLFPGFGYLSQTELVSTGLFRPDRVLIQKAELQGTVLSVKAHGDYYYDHSLEVDAQVVPMRKGVAASVLRVLTFPVSKLFEFTLQGTVENPEWRPTNLPKQLFLKFD